MISLIWIPIVSFLFDLFLVTLNLRHLNRHQDHIDDVATVSYIKAKSRGKILLVFLRQAYLAWLIIDLLDRIVALTTNIWNQPLFIVVVTACILYTIYQLLATLSDWIDTFVTEQRFGFNNHSQRSFFHDQLVDYVATVLIIAIVALVMYVLYARMGSSFLWFGLAFVALLLILYHTLFVVVFLPLMFEQSPLERPVLKEKILTLATRETIDIDRIVVINASKKTTKMNAYFSGFGKTKKILLFDTILDRFTEDQLVAIVAHEIGHAKYHHMIKDLIADLLLAGVYFTVFYAFLQADPGTTSATSFLFALVGTMITVEFAHKLLKGLRNFLYRRHEKQADLYVKQIGLADELKTVMKAAALNNKGNPVPHPLFVLFKYDHPSSTERLRYL